MRDQVNMADEAKFCSPIRSTLDLWASLRAQLVKNIPAMQETQV